MPTSEIPLNYGMRGKTTSFLPTFEQATTWISRVYNPLILVGGGAIQANVRDELIEFATQLEIPVINTVRAKGIIPETHPLSLGTVDLSQACSRYGFDWADLVITVGCKALECSPQYWNPDGDIPILHIGAAAAEINRHYHPHVELVGDLSDLLSGLLKQINRRGELAAFPLKPRALTRTAPGQSAFPQAD